MHAVAASCSYKRRLAIFRKRWFPPGKEKTLLKIMRISQAPEVMSPVDVREGASTRGDGVLGRTDGVDRSQGLIKRWASSGSTGQVVGVVLTNDR